MYQQHVGESSKLLPKLEAIKTEKAKYPYEAQERQLQGQVLVNMHVTETGDVDNVEVVSGDPILAKSAVDCSEKVEIQTVHQEWRSVRGLDQNAI